MRELREELGAEAAVGEILQVIFHRYREKSVLLLFYQASWLAGSEAPRPIGVQQLAWRSAAELHNEEFAPADVSVLSKIRGLLGNQPMQPG